MSPVPASLVLRARRLARLRRGELLAERRAARARDETARTPPAGIGAIRAFHGARAPIR